MIRTYSETAVYVAIDRIAATRVDTWWSKKGPEARGLPARFVRLPMFSAPAGRA
jgi:hypothetical protein